MNHALEEIKEQLGDNELSEPLTEEQIAAFEREHQIVLPEDYRDFLKHIGNGGDGPPGYGMLGLGETPNGDTPSYLENGYQDRLRKSFPLTEPCIWEEEEPSTELDQKLESVESGCLCLGHDGCGMYWLLIVSGKERGKIWQTTEVGIVPCSPSLAFTEWYLRWLKGDTEWWKDL